MDNIFLLCNKQVTRAPIKFCKWEGVLADYIHHVKRKHEKSYIELKPRQRQRFKWSLPQQGDQMDEGVIICDKQYYFYKLSYKNSTKEFQFTLQNIDGDVKPCCFTLHKAHGGREVELNNYFETSVFNAKDNPRGVVITKNDIINFTENYGIFKWSLCINNNKN